MAHAMMNRATKMGRMALLRGNAPRPGFPPWEKREKGIKVLAAAG